MSSSRESLEAKVARYLVERRLVVTWVDDQRIQARVRGGETEHICGYSRGGYYCSCPAHKFGRRCVHVACLQAVTLRPTRTRPAEPQPGPLTAQKFRELQVEASATRNGGQR